MRADYPIECVPATPEYILAGIQEEWRQGAGLCGDAGEAPPTFAATVKQWREAMDLVCWSPLGHALNKQWGTSFSQWEWFGVLVPAGEKNLGDVCRLLARQARRPKIPPAKLLGHECPEAGLVLAIRALLVRAGATPRLKPSTSLESYLKRWPKVFLKGICSLAPGGVPFTFEASRFGTVAVVSFILGIVCLAGGAASSEPWGIIVGVLLFALGWFGGFLEGSWIHGPLELDGATTFRDLTQRVFEQQRRCGVGDPQITPRN
ncbi:MAG TPA: hypothetical protein P5555_21160 [Candidatus Paceibacterota bacterium]|nr:hypothetical protein [Candidatus Paceibacterota bacterium]